MDGVIVYLTLAIFIGLYFAEDIEQWWKEHNARWEHEQRKLKEKE